MADLQHDQFNPHDFASLDDIFQLAMRANDNITSDSSDAGVCIGQLCQCVAALTHRIQKLESKAGWSVE